MPTKRKGENCGEYEGWMAGDRCERDRCEGYPSLGHAHWLSHPVHYLHTKGGSFTAASGIKTVLSPSSGPVIDPWFSFKQAGWNREIHLNFFFAFRFQFHFLFMKDVESGRAGVKVRIETTKYSYNAN